MLQYSAELSTAATDNSEALSLFSFEAIPSLTRPDADTTLVFLSLNASYLNEVRDPWFRSTIPIIQSESYSTSTGDSFTLNFTIYTADAPVNVVACAEQHQLRNPVTGSMSRLGGQEVVTQSQAHLLNFNEDQMNVFNRSFYIATEVNLYQILGRLTGSSLLATEDQYWDVVPGLPDNQWQLEFENWFGVALQSIQLWSQQYVSGPLGTKTNQYLVPAAQDFTRNMCGNQITRRDDYRSFSVLGLTVILVFGILVTFANLTVGSIVQTMQAQTQKGRYRTAEWQANDFLQLQRMAYQHNNTGTWSGHTDLVPITNAGEVFTIPESTKWNQSITERYETDRKRTQIWSRRSKISQSRAADTPSSKKSVETSSSTAYIEKEII